MSRRQIDPRLDVFDDEMVTIINPYSFAGASILDLDGSTNYASVGDTAALSITGDMSLSAWIWLDELPSVGGNNFQVITKYYTTGNNRSYLLEVGSDNKLEIIFSNNGTSAVANTTLVLADVAFTSGDTGKWLHVAATIDVSGPTVILYVDGSVRASTASRANAASIYNSTASFAIGALNVDGTPLQYFNGRIKQVAVWNDIRTSGEISTSHTDQYEDEGNANIVAYWKINEGSGSDLDNAEGTAALDLTVSGTPVWI